MCNYVFFYQYLLFCVLRLYYIIHMHILEEQWNILTTLIDQYYPIFKIWGFFWPFVFIRHPDDLQVTKYKRNSIFYN